MSEIGDILNDAMGGLDILGVRGATLRRSVAGTRGSDVTAGSEPTVTDYPCNAFKEDKLQRVQSFFEFGGAGGSDSLARMAVPVINIFGSSLPVDVKPKAGDVILFPSAGGTIQEFTVLDDAADPVDGVYVCNCKGS